MKRRLWISLVATVLIVFGALAGNLATGNTPILGIDLQGGISVILAPDENASDVGGDDLLLVRDLVRDELERLGIAEPIVQVQGETIVVDLPGVDDTEEARRAVNVSGIVELRPVLSESDCATIPSEPLVIDDGQTISPDTDLATVTTDEDGNIVVGDPATTDDVTDTTGDVTDDDPTSSTPAVTTGEVESPSTEPQSIIRPRRAPADDPATTDAPPVSEAPADDTEPVDSVPVDEPVDEPVISPTPIPSTPVTPGAEILPTRDGFALCVGPDQNVGDVLVFERGGARADLIPNWGVTADLRPGDGTTFWNSLAQQCFNRTSSCSSGQLAIVLDGVVQSAPSVNTPSFDDVVSITGAFTESEARSLASVLNRGAFPFQVVEEDVRTISAAAGGDSLRAAIIAGLIGVALVLMFLLLYYRWFALVILSGLTIWAATVFSAASFVSGATNFSLSLAGVTGIIVAVGVTVDSYVVFFERMKDEIRNGRTLKNAGPRSFKVTWRTIWSADLVSVIGAGILFWLSVGSVRGFALYLGITTLCDLVVCYFFTRPAVLLLARSKFMVGKRAFGLEVAS